MSRISVPEADARLDKKIPALDHGFERLVNYLGGDSRIVAGARVSYGPGTKSFWDDKALTHYLIRNLHTSPSEHVLCAARLPKSVVTRLRKLLRPIPTNSSESADVLKLLD